jgi:hypothetical protein
VIGFGWILVVMVPPLGTVGFVDIKTPATARM